MAFGSVVIVSGAPGAGKSSVARCLATTSPGDQAVHLHTDDFYANIVKGFIEPWRTEAHAQNTAVMAALVASSARYAQGGFEVVVDGIVGPWFLEPWLALARSGMDVHYVVLRPDEASTIARGTARTAPGALTDAAVISQMWRQFAELGAFEAHALDTSALTPDETVMRVRLAVNERHLLLR
ncbi:MAG TPA: AAA family ATPase [Polyangiaceae bacterium]|nr:AAA family ATPase [Polyangiaceae bacterium]